jgi:hypothetical protein
VTRNVRVVHVCYLVLSFLFALNLAWFAIEVLNGDWRDAVVNATIGTCAGFAALVLRQMWMDLSWTPPVDATTRQAVHEALYVVSRNTGRHPVNHLLIESVERNLLNHLSRTLRGPDGTTTEETQRPEPRERPGS